MHRRTPDKLDLSLLKIEAKKDVEVSSLVIQACLDQCSENHPNCPYLKSTIPCESIRDIVDELVPEILERIRKDN